MKTLSLFIFLIFVSFTLPPGFLEEQKKFERVRTAITEKDKIINDRLKGAGLRSDNIHILFVAYKESDELELYVKERSGKTYKKLTAFWICARSGGPGPKRRRGDGQVPEGFYHVSRFNPLSSLYLSLGLNYPNASDRIKSTYPNLGGDIFIHGNCVTIGCLPMTDDTIKEIYLYAVYARNNGQMKIPVYMFPFRMNETNMESHKLKYADNPVLLEFWANLKTGYDRFEKDKEELTFSVDAKGNYTF